MGGKGKLAAKKVPTCTLKFFCLGNTGDEKPDAGFSASAGGYELLLHQRGGIDQGFHKIPTPHTPSRIKELASQATIYIRPLQMNIEGLESTDKQVLQLSEVSLASHFF